MLLALRLRAKKKSTAIPYVGIDTIEACTGIAIAHLLDIVHHNLAARRNFHAGRVFYQTRREARIYIMSNCTKERLIEPPAGGTDTAKGRRDRKHAN